MAQAAQTPVEGLQQQQQQWQQQKEDDQWLHRFVWAPHHVYSAEVIRLMLLLLVLQVTLYSMHTVHTSA
jgi:hypothetical protein